MRRFMALLGGLLFLSAGATAAERPRSLPGINSGRDFASLSAPPSWFSGGSEWVHLLIDPANGGRLYFFDSRRYPGHREFIQAGLLSSMQGRAFNEEVLYPAEPRFIAGTVLAGKAGETYSLVIWNNPDFRAGGLDISSVLKRVKTAFGPPLRGPLPPPRPEKGVLSPGKCQGRIDRRGGPAGIIVADSESSDMPLACGYIFTGYASQASHLAVLAAEFGLPVVYWPGFSPPEGGPFFELAAGKDGTISLLPSKAPPEQALTSTLLKKTLPSDLEERKVRTLGELRGPDHVRYGAKAANLGELINSGLDGFIVPPGFAVPFSFYAEFIRANGLADEISSIADSRNGDGEDVSSSLARLREKIELGNIPESSRAALLSAYGNLRRSGGGVYVRSSSNAEDLPFFSGAGLYTTVPNVKKAGAFLSAVKKVWASVWNEKAFLAREASDINHMGVHMGLLLQTAAEGRISGVMFTRSREDREKIFIACKGGAGTSVVGGGKAETALVGRSGGVSISGLSDPGDELFHATRGGLTGRPPGEARRLLTEEKAAALAATGLKIEHHFGGAAQDIEWVLSENGLSVVQSRAYSAGR